MKAKNTFNEALAAKNFQKTRKIKIMQEDIELLKANYLALKEAFDVLVENYNTHAHNYTDATIADTADGTGTLSETTKQTTTKT